MEIVILVGLQASGKSSFRRSRFDATHVVVSKDNFRSNRRPARRQDHLIREALQAGKPVVGDNTKPRREDREALIRLAREFSVPVIGYFLRSSFQEALVRNARREGAARIPDVGVYSTAMSSTTTLIFSLRIGPQHGFHDTHRSRTRRVSQTSACAPAGGRGEESLLRSPV